MRVSGPEPHGGSSSTTLERDGLGRDHGLGRDVDGRRWRLAGRRDLDLVQLGTRRRWLDLTTEVGEVGFDRGTEAVAVAGRVRVERVGVGAQLLASGGELEDLGFEPATLTFRDAPSSRLGIADQRLRLGFGLLEQLARPRLRLVHRVVGRALSEQQGALQHVGVVAARRERDFSGGCRGRRPAGDLLHPLGEALDGDGGALEEVVDLVAVVAAPRVLDLAAAEFLRSHIHGRPW